MIANGKTLKIFNRLMDVHHTTPSELNYKHYSMCTKNHKPISIGVNTSRSRYLGESACSLHAEVCSLLDYQGKKRVLRNQPQQLPQKVKFICSAC